MSVGSVNEIVRMFVEYSQDNLLTCRLVGRTWKSYVDELCYKKMSAFPVDVAQHKARLLYLKLKHFVPQIFLKMPQQALPL
ncbi:MAG: hypothetical protein LLF94_01605, partial [Chlamydiales bacterium]|nr:hypothetical protein [Chlamydiales bacterium]